PSASVAPSASSKPGSWRAGRLAREAAVLSTSSRVASVCSACHRLNGSASCAARNRRSSAERLAESLMGVENPRLSEATGRSATSANTNVSTDLVKGSTPSSTPPPSPALVGGGARRPPATRNPPLVRPRPTGRGGAPLGELEPIAFHPRIVAAGRDDLGGAR